MNAISLYVSTSRLVFQKDVNDQTWTDLYRLVPYLRQALSCTVCGFLLTEPYSPSVNHCQHHVCRLCLGGHKNLQPNCSWCENYDKYAENMQLRILLQCYKSLCEHIIDTPMYNIIREHSQAAGIISNGLNIPHSSLVEFLEEGAKFEDNFKSKGCLSHNTCSVLPCIYPKQRQTENNVPQNTGSNSNNPAIMTADVPTNSPQLPMKGVSNGTTMYSVLHTGIGNKITIRRTTDKEDDSNSGASSRSKPISRRRGCRCGNATATPGKLTCCGQRCPCYVDSKSCLNCKCRGCRNPHQPNGRKIRPHLPDLGCLEIQMRNECNNMKSEALASTPRNCLELYNSEYGISHLSTIDTNSTTFANHLRQPVHLENVGRESLLIRSAEGNFQVLNVFTSPANAQNFQSSTLNRQDSLNNSQIHHSCQTSDISTIPQILMQTNHNPGIQPQELLTSTRGPTITLTPHHTSLPMSAASALSSNTIAISPLIYTSSRSYPPQIFNNEDVTKHCTSQNSIQSQTLVDLVVSSERASSDSLNV